MAKLSKDQGAGTLHPRETLYAAGTLGALNAEVVIAADGAASVTLDLRGTFNLSVEVAGSVDGVNWTPIPVRPLNQAGLAYALAIAGSSTGIWTGKCAAFRIVRARVTTFTSGAAVTLLAADNAPVDDAALGGVTSAMVTATGAAGAAVILNLPAPAAGLRHYLTYLSINRYAAAVLTASATPVVVTSSNLPGALAFTFEADAAALGTMIRWREDFAFPLAASLQASATSLSCPAIANVIWRATAGYFIAP